MSIQGLLLKAARCQANDGQIMFSHRITSGQYPSDIVYGDIGVLTIIGRILTALGAINQSSKHLYRYSGLECDVRSE